MQFSEQIDKLMPAVIAAWAEIPSAAKDAKNPHLKNDYATLAALAEAAKEPLAKHKLAVLQPVTYQRMDNGDTAPVVETYVVHESGQWMMSPFSMTPVDQKPQTLGSVVTYIRRYAVGGMLFMIAEKDDDGNAASGTTGTPRQVHSQKPPAPTPKAETAVPESPVKALRNKVMEISGCDLNTIKIFFQGIWPDGAPKDPAAYSKPLEDLLVYISRGEKEIASLKANPSKLGQMWVAQQQEGGEATAPAEETKLDTADINAYADAVAKKRGIGTGAILLKTIDKLFANVPNYKTDEALAKFLGWYEQDADAFEQLKASAKLGITLTEMVERD